MKKRRYVQVTTSVIWFWKNVYHIYATAEVKVIDVTYLQYESVHMTFVAGNNARIVVMARPKLSQCTYTSTNKAINVLQPQVITVTMYTACIVDGFFILSGIPDIRRRKIIEPKRLFDSSFSLGSCLFMWK